MASFKDDYGRFYCKYCDVTVKKNPAAMNQHLLGNRHKRNVALFLQKMRNQNKADERAERETQKELRRIQAITGIQLCPQQQPPHTGALGKTQFQPPPGKVRALPKVEDEEEEEDSLEEKINEAVDEAVRRVTEINTDEYCAAAEAYYLKMNNGSSVGLEEFVKAAKMFIVNEISAKSVEAGEAAPVIGAWTVVNEEEDGGGSIYGGVLSREDNLESRKDPKEEKLDEADAILGEIGSNGTAQPRRPVGYHSLYENNGDDGCSAAPVKTEDEGQNDLSGLFKKKRKRGGNSACKK